MNTLPEFCAGKSADEAHEALESALKIEASAHQCSLDWFGDIFERKLYKELGFSSMNQYAKELLGFSDTKIGDFLKLTRDLKELPILKGALSEGKIGYTVGRTLTGIVDSSTEKEWVDMALENPRRVVEGEIKRAKRDAKEKASGQQSLLPVPKKKTPVAVIPVIVKLEMSPTQFARYEAMWEQVRKQRKLSSEKVEALLEIMASFLDDDVQNATPRGEHRGEPGVNSRPTAQIHIHHCPECESATVQTSKGELEIGKSELERAQCDCQINQSGQRNKTSIPPATRRRVLANARHKCQTPGCNHTHFIEIHHIIPRDQSGTNDESNLQVLCSLCHALVHKNRAGFLVKSPSAIYTWNHQNTPAHLIPTKLDHQPGMNVEQKTNSFIAVSPKQLRSHGNAQIQPEFVLEGNQQTAFSQNQKSRFTALGVVVTIPTGFKNMFNKRDPKLTIRTQFVPIVGTG